MSSVAGGGGSAGRSTYPPSAAELEARGGGLLQRLQEAEPSLSATFTSAGQRAQLLSVLEVLRPPPGMEVQRRGEESDGILLIESGTLLQRTPWDESSVSASYAERINVEFLKVSRRAALT